uniref:Uncharacterized protein n=1 Tax=viral metagenome TaxID=1070528 RepID=A0A6M3JEG2_9ZZZZ
MSTRCQIGFYNKKEDNIKDFQALIYRHSDGYPEGVIPDIEPFLKWWAKGRGLGDVEYVSARLLQYLCNQYDEDGKAFAKEMRSKNIPISKTTEELFTGTLGHGICRGFHWDIEYFYKIYPNAIEIYDVPFMDKFDEKQFKLIKTIKLEE